MRKENKVMLNIQVTDALFDLIRTVFANDRVLSEENAEIVKNNLPDIYEISKRNDVAHLVGYALEKQGLISPEDELFAKFQKQQYLAIYRCEGMEYEIARMREVLEDGDIDFILLKGAVIRGLYPEGWMRTSSDIDILVRSESIDAAESLLSGKLGYKRVQEGTHDRSLYTDGGVHVELHFSLVEDDRANFSAEVLKDVWNYVDKETGKEHEYRLSDGMFYFYHIAHLAKHVEFAGSGMRPFIDLWLINNKMTIDTIKRNELLQRGQLERFASLCDELSGYWMESKAASEDAKRLELFVLNCGIYGSEENRIAIDRERRGGTLGYIFRRLFLPYSVLKQLYPVIVKHKWLTPFCQVARWFKLVTGEKTRKAINEVKTSASTSRSDVDNMQAFLGDIGLNKNKK